MNERIKKMKNLKKSIYLRALFFISLGIFSAVFATDEYERIGEGPKTSWGLTDVGWDRLRKIGGIWGRNTLQTFGLCDCLGYDPLPIASRSSNGLAIYLEDRLGYALAPVNWLFYLNVVTLPDEGPNTMLIRGLVKKYNVEVCKILVSPL
jgi:hypothetical protein